MANVIQPEKVDIDGVTFWITPFSAYEAIKLKVSFLKKIAPAFGQLLGDSEIKDELLTNQEPSSDKMNLNGRAFSGALSKLFETLNESEFIELVKRFTGRVQVQLPEGNAGELTNESVFNSVFTQKLSLLYKLIFQVIKINYPDFFVLMGSIGNRLKTALGK